MKLGYRQETTPGDPRLACGDAVPGMELANGLRVGDEPPGLQLPRRDLPGKPPLPKVCLRMNRELGLPCRIRTTVLNMPQCEV